MLGSISSIKLIEPVFWNLPAIPIVKICDIYAAYFVGK